MTIIPLISIPSTPKYICSRSSAGSGDPRRPPLSCSDDLFPTTLQRAFGIGAALVRAAPRAVPLRGGSQSPVHLHRTDRRPVLRPSAAGSHRPAPADYYRRRRLHVCAAAALWATWIKNRTIGLPLAVAG